MGWGSVHYGVWLPSGLREGLGWGVHPHNPLVVSKELPPTRIASFDAMRLPRKRER